jgi:hypothetical protein
VTLIVIVALLRVRTAEGTAVGRSG